MRHLPLKQQPLSQALPAQQASPGPPHEAQTVPVLVELQTVPALQRSVPLVPAQQGSPGLPQDEQKPPLHTRSAPQLVPQQAWPKAPQLEHLPPEQVPPGLPPVP